MTTIQAYFPEEQRIYNINRIFDLNRKVIWKSKEGTEGQFNYIYSSPSIFELQLASGQKIPETGIIKEYEHFLLRSDSQMFKNPNNYRIYYNTNENSATFTIMPTPKPMPKPKKLEMPITYGIEGVYIKPDSFKGKKPDSGGRHRSRATFRQQRVKRAAAKSRRRTRRV